MNSENEIKNQLFQKYSKELKAVETSRRDFFNLPLSEAASRISFYFESEGLECPPDVCMYIDESNSFQNASNPGDDNADSNDQLQMAIQASKEEFNRQQQNSYAEMKPLNIPSFDISKFRCLNTDENTAQQRGISCENLLEYRKDLVKDLATFDDIVGIRYKDLIEKYKNITNQPTNGITISILLHTGDRISKIFESEDAGSTIYYWTASQDKMIKDNIKPGHFIIIRNTGDEIVPDVPIKDQITEKQILLNVRLL